MIEYNDGSLSEVISFAEAVKKAELEENVKALHIGTEESLRQLKECKEQETKEVSAVVAYYGETLIRAETALTAFLCRQAFRFHSRAYSILNHKNN